MALKILDKIRAAEHEAAEKLRLEALEYFEYLEGREEREPGWLDRQLARYPANGRSEG